MAKKMMLCECEKGKIGATSMLVLGGLMRNLGAILLISGLAGGLYKLIQNMTAKRQQEATTGGFYGAAAIARVFKGADFPLSKQDILQKYGDREIEYHLGKKERLSDIIQDIPDQTFNRTTDLEHAVHEKLKSH